MIYSDIEEKNAVELLDEYEADYVIDPNEGEIIYQKDAAIFIHLYYEELKEYCFRYIESALLVCDVYITTPNLKIKQYIEQQLDQDIKHRCKVVLVENRGRDIAALLIHHRERILKYKYFAFLHDKKSMHIENEKHGAMWCDLLWENIVKSPQYIVKVVRCLRENEKLGVLSVPEPYWGEFVSLFSNGWCGNYEAVEKLAKELGLKCRLDKKYPPITIGTAFWARSEALLPLLEYSFQLDDFLNDEVTSLSYAVERIFAYVAQNQGFYTGIVSTKGFSYNRNRFMQQMVVSCMNILQHRYCWNSSEQIERVASVYEEIDEFIENHDAIYMFGDLPFAIEIFRRFPALVNRIQGFCVENKKRKVAQLCDKPVFEISEISQDEAVGFILLCENNNINEKIQYLLLQGINKRNALSMEKLLKCID